MTIYVHLIIVPFVRVYLHRIYITDFGTAAMKNEKQRCNIKRQPNGIKQQLVQFVQYRTNSL